MQPFWMSPGSAAPRSVWAKSLNATRTRSAPLVRTTCSRLESGEAMFSVVHDEARPFTSLVPTLKVTVYRYVASSAPIAEGSTMWFKGRKVWTKSGVTRR